MSEVHELRLRRQRIAVQTEQMRLSTFASKQRLEDLQRSAITHDELGDLRHELVEIVRGAHCHLRLIRVEPGLTRPWSGEDDHPRQNSQLVAEEVPTGLQLQVGNIELQATGKVAAIRGLLRSVQEQGWLMGTEHVELRPLDPQGELAELILRVSVYGLTKALDESV